MTRTLFVAALLLAAGSVQAQEAYIGEIKLVGYNFCPRGSTEANGQLIAISQNPALFSLYGATYGGDGRTTFALPDLRGRVPVHVGQAPGLSDYPLGAKGGAETTTLSARQLPPHSHGATAQLNGTNAPATSPTPDGNLPALSTSASIYGVPQQGGSTVAMRGDAVAVTVQPAGGGEPVDIRQPYQVMRYCVVLQGLFPSRN